MSRPRDDACWFTRGQQRQALAKVNRGFSEADGPTDSQPSSVAVAQQIGLAGEGDNREDGEASPVA
jgi:hypothetical protein